MKKFLQEFKKVPDYFILLSMAFLEFQIVPFDDE